MAAPPHAPDGARDRQKAGTPSPLAARHLPDTVTGAVETGLGITLLFAALTAHQPTTAVVVLGLGIATTAGMCHSYRERRGVTRDGRRTAAVWAAGLVGLVVLTLTLSADLPRHAPLLVSPVVLALVEFGLRWLAERGPALTPWHAAGWLLSAASCLAPLLVPHSQVVMVSGLVCAVSLIVMGAVDNHRLTTVVGPTPPSPKGPPNPVMEWLRERFGHRDSAGR